jgi:hypothetical protein
MQPAANRAPVFAKALPLDRQEQSLKGFIELADRFVLGDTFIAL